MTDQHPLTNEVIHSQENWGCVCYEGIMYDRSDLRAATDWQLKQVIEWLRSSLDGRYVWADNVFREIDRERVIADLEQAMRPITQEDN